jgi:hypothetical protein
MARIETCELVGYDERTQQIERTGRNRDNWTLGMLRRQLAAGRVRVEPAGPGWGDRNYLIITDYDELTADGLDIIHGAYLVKAAADGEAGDDLLQAAEALRTREAL